MLGGLQKQLFLVQIQPGGYPVVPKQDQIVHRHPIISRGHVKARKKLVLTPRREEVLQENRD